LLTHILFTGDYFLYGQDLDEHTDAMKGGYQLGAIIGQIIKIVDKDEVKVRWMFAKDNRWSGAWYPWVCRKTSKEVTDTISVR
jgi:hypothetical protein